MTPDQRAAVEAIRKWYQGGGHPQDVSDDDEDFVRIARTHVGDLLAALDDAEQRAADVERIVDYCADNFTGWSFKTMREVYRTQMGASDALD